MFVTSCANCQVDMIWEDPRSAVTKTISPIPCKNCGAEVCHECADRIVCADCRVELCGRCALQMEDGDRYCELCALAVIDIEAEEWAEIRRAARNSRELVELEHLAKHGIEHEIEDTRPARVRRYKLDAALGAYCAALGQDNPIAAAQAGVDLAAVLSDPLWRHVSRVPKERVQVCAHCGSEEITYTVHLATDPLDQDEEGFYCRACGAMEPEAAVTWRRAA